MRRHSEPAIKINGVVLTVAQAMTVRVAMESFAIDLIANGLGDDDHGKAMVEGYMKAISGIRTAMAKSEEQL